MWARREVLAALRYLVRFDIAKPHVSLDVLDRSIHDLIYRSGKSKS
jgi:hypothetical protein